jgi:hypothetical protein
MAKKINLSQPFKNLKYYVVNRFIDHTHQLTAHKNHLKRGNWYDVDHRFLPCLFDTLVDFIEIELAYCSIAGGDKKYKLPRWYEKFLFWNKWRCPEAGINHLKWEMTLIYDENSGVFPGEKNYGKPTSQALAAREQLELYNWYTTIYYKRRDSGDLSGWTDYYKELRKKYGNILAITSRKNMTVAERKKERDLMKKSMKLEDQYEQEDTNMLIRLIKIRRSLWT